MHPQRKGGGGKGQPRKICSFPRLSLLTDLSPRGQVRMPQCCMCHGVLNITFKYSMHEHHLRKSPPADAGGCDKG